LCIAIGKVDERFSAAKAISTADRSSCFFAKLISTVKTHKTPGEVSLRAIHSAPRYSFRGISTWVCWWLDKVLRRQSHLCFSTEDVLDRLVHIQPLIRDFPNFEFVRFDLNDFYMTGAPDDLSYNASRCASYELWPHHAASYQVSSG